MSLSGEREEGSQFSKMSLSGEHDTKAKRPIKQERPASPVPSCVSMKSDWSMDPPITFREGDFSTEQRPIKQERPASPVPSCVSMKSDWSMDPPLNFREGDFSTEQSPIKQERPASPVPSCVSMKSDQSMMEPIEFRKGDFSTEQRYNVSRLVNRFHILSQTSTNRISSTTRPIKQERPASPVPSCVSMKSDWSMSQPLQFREGDFSTEQR
ncbi:uncharacterized protein LOC135568546 [Oncorhynchus nerka]|uniref:uncharacterized protein LOC135568546 n=1 Tax=Oncorhynchus nerka TaxID=8023 RepID=UPI0031B845D6